MAAMLGFGSINLRVDFSEGWPPKKKNYQVDASKKNLPLVADAVHLAYYSS